MPAAKRKKRKVIMILLCAIIICAGVLVFLFSLGSERSGNENRMEVVAEIKGQTLKVGAGKHISEEADSFRVELYDKNGKGRLLSTGYIDHDKDKAVFEGLNPGEMYRFIVSECVRSGEGHTDAGEGAAYISDTLPLICDHMVFGEGSYTVSGNTQGDKELTEIKKDKRPGYTAVDFQNNAVSTDDKVQGKVYKDKEKIRMMLENAALMRKKKLTLYYPEKVPDFGFTDGSLLLDDEVCSVAYTWYYYNDRNLYGQPIRLMGRKCYRYDFHFDYHYPRRRQERYLPKILKIRRILKGNDSEKVKKFDAYFRKNCTYDDTLTKGDPYDAIVGGVAVCDGYARGAYMILNMAGVPCEYMYGRGNGGGGWESHAWNLCKAGGRWYQNDFTWDSSLDKTTYLMKGKENSLFAERHVSDGKFETKKWKNAHPISEKDFDYQK